VNTRDLRTARTYDVIIFAGVRASKTFPRAPHAFNETNSSRTGFHGAEFDLVRPSSSGPRTHECVIYNGGYCLDTRREIYSFHRFSLLLLLLLTIIATCSCTRAYKKTKKIYKMSLVKIGFYKIIRRTIIVFVRFSFVRYTNSNTSNVGKVLPHSRGKSCPGAAPPLLLFSF